MDILELRVIRGPNYWSNDRKNLIVLTLDLKEFEELPSHLIPGFVDNLITLLPSLYDHYCSYDQPGGFIRRLHEGTWLGHIVEHVALELQTLAGSLCGFGRTRSTDIEGVYDVVFSYEYEELGIKAGDLAFKLVKTLAHNKSYQTLSQTLIELEDIYRKEKNGPSTEALLKEAERRKIPYKIFDKTGLILLGHGCHQKMLWATVTGKTSLIGGDIAADKALTKRLLKAEFIPVPDGVEVTNEEELNKALKQFPFPLAIKPLNSNHGKGVTINILSREKAMSAFYEAKKISNEVIVEKFINGKDYRLLIINYKFVAVANRIPAMVTGTGKHTVRELIEEVNKDPKRGVEHTNHLTKIIIDEKTKDVLAAQNVHIDTILSNGQKIYLKQVANLSVGGTPIDVTDKIHPKNIFLAERIARIMQLDICGVDLIATDISVPITEENAAVIEVNASPGLRMHLSPTLGKPINVAKPILDMLFPNNQNPRIPIIAVTGTNGKTSVVRIISHLAKSAGYSVGFTTTDGIYINNMQITKGDCAGPSSAFRILRDPIIDFAVLETARGGIIRAGLGFDHCNVSIVTNISGDHLGINGINTLEKLARVKSVVPHSTFKDGYAILNADDDLVFAMKKDLECNIALFSIDCNNQRIQAHCQSGGLAAYIENEYLIVQDGHIKSNIINYTALPITFFGKSVCMIKNLLPSILASILTNIGIDTIKIGLNSFNLSHEFFPGRMNIFNFGRFQVLLDYAHNPDAFLHLKDFMKHIHQKKIGIIAATGDRRNEDIIKIGALSAEIFDEIIIRHDKDGRGRSNQELTDLLLNGIKSIDKKVKTLIISDEFAAIQFVIDNAPLNSFIFYFPDNIWEAIEYLNKVKNNMRALTVT